MIYSAVTIHQFHVAAICLCLYMAELALGRKGTSRVQTGGKPRSDTHTQRLQTRKLDRLFLWKKGNKRIYYSRDPSTVTSLGYNEDLSENTVVQGLSLQSFLVHVTQITTWETRIWYLQPYECKSTRPVSGTPLVSRSG